MDAHPYVPLLRLSAPVYSFMADLRVVYPKTTDLQPSGYFVNRKWIALNPAKELKSPRNINCWRQRRTPTDVSPGDTLRRFAAIDFWPQGTRTHNLGAKACQRSMWLYTNHALEESKMEFLLRPTGVKDELVSLRVSVEARLLEDLLEALARLDFPVNPQLYHRPLQVTVEFRASSTRVDDVRAALSNHGFSASSLEVTRVLAVIPKS